MQKLNLKKAPFKWLYNPLNSTKFTFSVCKQVLNKKSDLDLPSLLVLAAIMNTNFHHLLDNMAILESSYIDKLEACLLFLDLPTFFEIHVDAKASQILDILGMIVMYLQDKETLNAFITTNKATLGFFSRVINLLECISLHFAAWSWSHIYLYMNSSFSTVFGLVWFCFYKFVVKLSSFLIFINAFSEDTFGIVVLRLQNALLGLPYQSVFSFTTHYFACEHDDSKSPLDIMGLLSMWYNCWYFYVSI